MEIAKMIVEILSEIMKALVDAFSSDDPSKLRKVTDILPVGSQLKSRAELLHQEEIARRQFNSIVHRPPIVVK